MEIVFATNNKNKLQEIRKILNDHHHILSLSDIGCHADIPETGNTLEENSFLKANYVFQRYEKDCFADDTGLEVSALNGAPGVHSARYAEGKDHDSEANMQKLLHQLEGVSDRRARFRTVITLIRKAEPDRPLYFEGIINGRIAIAKHGNNGFGYDPIFIPDGYDQSFAQLGLDMKNKISHRAMAVNKLADYLKQLNNEV